MTLRGPTGLVERRPESAATGGAERRSRDARSSAAPTSGCLHGRKLTGTPAVASWLSGSPSTEAVMACVRTRLATAGFTGASRRGASPRTPPTRPPPPPSTPPPTAAAPACRAAARRTRTAGRPPGSARTHARATLHLLELGRARRAPGQVRPTTRRRARSQLAVEQRAERRRPHARRWPCRRSRRQRRLTQLAAAAVDAAAHGADGDAEGLGDLLVGQAHDVAQHDRGAVVVGQPSQRGLHLVGERLGGRLSSAAAAGGTARSGSSGRASSGRRRRRRTSSRKALVVILLNHPSSEPGRYVSSPRRTRSSTSCTRSCASSSLPVRR